MESAQKNITIAEGSFNVINKQLCFIKVQNLIFQTLDTLMLIMQME